MSSHLAAKDADTWPCHPQVAQDVHAPAARWRIKIQPELHKVTLLPKQSTTVFCSDCMLADSPLGLCYCNTGRRLTAALSGDVLQNKSKYFRSCDNRE